MHSTCQHSTTQWSDHHAFHLSTQHHTVVRSPGIPPDNTVPQWSDHHAFHLSTQYHIMVRSPGIPPVNTVPHSGQITRHSTCQHSTTQWSDHQAFHLSTQYHTVVRSPGIPSVNTVPHSGQTKSLSGERRGVELSTVPSIQAGASILTMGAVKTTLTVIVYNRWHHHQPATAALQTNGRTSTAEMPASADSKNKRVANGSPATHQTLRQRGGTGDDGHIHPADWTLGVAAIEKKKKKRCTIALPGADNRYAGNNNTNFTFHGWASGWMGALDSLVRCVSLVCCFFCTCRYGEIINREFFPNTGKIVCRASVALVQQTSACAVTVVSAGKSLMLFLLASSLTRTMMVTAWPTPPTATPRNRPSSPTLTCDPTLSTMLPSCQSPWCSRAGWPGVKHRLTNLRTYSFLPTIDHSTTLFTDQTFGTATTSILFLLQPFSLQFFWGHSIRSSLASFIMVPTLICFTALCVNPFPVHRQHL